jgi:phosphatidate phosphatase APP1
MSYWSSNGYGSGAGARAGNETGYDGGREPGARRKKLAAMAGKMYNAGAAAVSEIKESYNQTRSGQVEGFEASKISIPGSFPDVAIAVQGDEQMVLFPSYAKRHIKGQSRQFQNPAGPPHPASVDLTEEDYWRQKWERQEDERAIVDVDVRGWIYNPHRGPMTRRNRILVGLARQLSGIPAPRMQAQSLQVPATSSHQQHEEEREQMRIAEEAQKIERRGQAEKEAAQSGGYSERPNGSDWDYDAHVYDRHRSRSPSPVGRTRSASPSAVVDRINSAASTEMSDAELAVANANLMARLAPFLTTPRVQMPITVFFYNDTKSQSRNAETDDAGHFILRAALDFVPTHVRVLANEDLSATETVQLIEPRGISLISDIDDTIKHSNITMGAKEIFRNTFVRDLKGLTVEGVREWYNSLHNLGVRIHYCSNSPWQLYPVIATYFKLAGLPHGSIHLKRYSGMLQGIFEPVAERKKGTLERIMHDFPERRFMLVGDSGEADLEVYTEIALANPGRIVAIFIRDVTTPEQTGYFDSGFRSSNNSISSTSSDQRRTPHASSNQRGRNMDSDHRMNRPALPTRTTTPSMSSRQAPEPEMEDLIDLSDAPQLPPRDSRPPLELQDSPSFPQGNTKDVKRKPAPPRPAKPMALKSTPSFPLSGPTDNNVPSEQKKPPPPPQARQAKPSYSHPLAQMQNSSQPTFNDTHSNFSASTTSVASMSSKSSAPPPPPPRRRLTPSSTMTASPQLLPTQRRPASNTDFDTMESLQLSATPSTGYNNTTPSEPYNKKLDLWQRRLHRAHDSLDREGVALYTWRRGYDVIEEAVGIVKMAMKDMGLQEGLGERRDLQNRR